MASDLPYSQSPARLPDIFSRIKAAGTPPRYNSEFIKTVLGFASSNDRASIAILRKLGFISQGGEPTQRYNDYKGHAGGLAMADGLREGWSSLFMRDQNIYKLSAPDVAKHVLSLTGLNEKLSQRVATTFTILCSLADWTQSNSSAEADKKESEKPQSSQTDQAVEQTSESTPSKSPSIQLHHDIHIHLPATSDASVYRAVFQAIKAELM